MPGYSPGSPQPNPTTAPVDDEPNRIIKVYIDQRVTDDQLDAAWAAVNDALSRTIPDGWTSSVTHEPA